MSPDETTPQAKEVWIHPTLRVVLGMLFLFGVAFAFQHGVHIGIERSWEAVNEWKQEQWERDIKVSVSHVADDGRRTLLLQMHLPGCSPPCGMDMPLVSLTGSTLFTIEREGGKGKP